MHVCVHGCVHACWEVGKVGEEMLVTGLKELGKQSCTKNSEDCTHRYKEIFKQKSNPIWLCVYIIEKITGWKVEGRREGNYCKGYDNSAEKKGNQVRFRMTRWQRRGQRRNRFGGEARS